MSRFTRFLSFYRPYVGVFSIVMLSALAAAACALALPLLGRAMTQIALSGGSPLSAGFLRLGAITLGVILGYVACEFIVDYHGHRVGALMEGDMRVELFAHYERLPFAFYDANHVGQLMSRLTNDLLSIAELCHHGPEDLTIALAKFAGAFVILVRIDARLALIVFAFLPLMALHAFVFHRRMTRALRRSRARIGDVNARVEESLAGVRVVASFTNEKLELDRFEHENRRLVESRSDGYRGEAYFSTGMIAFTQLITVAVIFFGGIAISRAAMSAADLVTFLLCVAILIDPVSRAVNISRLIQEGVTGFERFAEIAEIEPTIADAPDARDAGRVRGEIELDGVGFSYGADYEHVLRDVSLTIGQGEFVALVGSSGVGKSTLCSLIPRFYDVTSGAIRIDGEDVRSITLASLRANIGVVHQDVYLFAGTVAENIAYGRPGAPREAIVDAARRANAHEFIERLPHGYDTEIGQHGVRLSGGQKQRLSIARVFLKDAPIIIFDEATSALDNESERAVQRSLEELAHDRTMIVIAHRLSTIRNAKRIVVLADDGIAEQGTHDELIAARGVYASLYETGSRL